jgi:hypothetical protein
LAALKDCTMILPQQTVTVRIASGQALSAPLWIGNAALTALRMPPAWDAAALTLQCATDPVNGPWLDLHDQAGAEVSFAVAANRHVALTHNSLRGLLWVRVRSGTSGTPVNQAANRDLVLIFGGVA